MVLIMFMHTCCMRLAIATTRHLTFGTHARLNTRNLFFLAIWIALIFGTSCTVVRPNEFFQLLNSYVFGDTDMLAKFKVLWGSIWLFVVKGWHFTEFAVLQVLATRAVDWLRSSRTQSNVLIAALCCAVFAASDEWHQSFVPDRFGTVWDVFIDALGVLTAAYVLARVRRPALETSHVDADQEWPPVPDQPGRTEPLRKSAFSFWISGPATGACVVLAIVTASFVAWSVHDFPDMLFRSGHAAIVSVVLMTLGGALFGMVYGGILLISTRMLELTVRPRLHFHFAVILSIVASYVVSDISLRRRELVGVEISLAIIVLACFVFALATAVRFTDHGEIDK